MSERDIQDPETGERLGPLDPVLKKGLNPYAPCVGCAFKKCCKKYKKGKRCKKCPKA